MSKAAAKGARIRARELLVQALYQVQITGHETAELVAQFKSRGEYESVDQEYFDGALQAILADVAQIEQKLDQIADRPIGHLDPVEKAVLLLGYHELQSLPEIPYRVVINEAVNLARRFGAEEGHKYINALLDRASETLRVAERK